MARGLVLLISMCLSLSGCGAGAWVEPTGAFAAANAAAIPVFQRSVPDMLVSVLTGRDCSMVRLDRGQSYCRAEEPVPEPPPYCTRSLGVVDCWADPDALPNRPPQVADGPAGLTPAQEANRTRGWPGL
jgi:hypothetical protein